jgi:4-hydroxybenzoate polyprenyltransferase
LRVSTLRNYLELVRLPAVFTAVADVMMGYLVTRGELRPAAAFVVLATISALLYLAGMVLNDVFDAESDARERPERPIPSGCVSRKRAAVLGWGLLAAGVLLAIHISDHSHIWRITTVAAALAGCIVLYDAALKHTVAGPIAMGACRLLNVLLGMSLAAEAAARESVRAWTPAEWAIAAGVGVYVAGVTLLARGEAGSNTRPQLSAGAAIVLTGLAIIASVPAWSEPTAQLAVVPRGWYLLWAVLVLVIARRCVVAIVRPTPRYVQAAVRHCLRSIIVIDAAVVLGFCGVYWGCAVLLLLAPMLLLERWFATT